MYKTFQKPLSLLSCFHKFHKIDDFKPTNFFQASLNTKKSICNTLLKFFIFNNKNCDLKAHSTIILTIDKGRLKTSYPGFFRRPLVSQLSMLNNPIAIFYAFTCLGTKFIAASHDIGSIDAADHIRILSFLVNQHCIKER